MNSYYTDDIIQRSVILWVMALLVLYANNAVEITNHEEGLSALRTTVAAYMLARASSAAIFIGTSFASYQHRAQARLWACFMLMGLSLCVPLFFEEVSIRAKIALVVIIIVYQEFTWAITLSPWIKKKLNLKYSTAVDIAHEIDRMAAFFIIILGEFLYSIIAGNPAGIGVTSGYGKAVCTLVIAFSLNWLYVSGDGSVQATHPIRRSAWTAFGFFLLHLPLSMSFLIGGHICAVSVQLDEFEPGQRWLLGGGLGVGMLCLWIFAELYKTDDEDGELKFPKQIRVGPRLAVAVILAVLPETHDRLNTVEFMAVVMSLFVFVLMWETVGGLNKDARIWESWDGRNAPAEETVPVSEKDSAPISQ